MTMGPESVTEAELGELRRKFEAVEADRKAYYEVSMKTMMENKKVIASLREANKKRRGDLKAMRKKQAQGKLAREVPQADEHLERLEQHVTMIRKNLDAVTANVEARRAELESLRDEAAEVEVSSNARQVSAATPSQAKQIRSLENRLDRSIIKFNEAQSIRKTYEQIVARLKEERDNFDAHFSAMEKTIKVKAKDLADLETLSNDAQQARDVAQRELQRATDRLDADRKQRERDLRAKRQVADAAADMVSAVSKLDKNRRSVAARERGDLDFDEEARLRQATVIASMQARSANIFQQRANDALEEHDEVIVRIMKITGVSDVNEVVSKIVNQGEARANLDELMADNAAKIEELTATFESMRAELDRARFMGGTRVVQAARLRLDTVEAKLAEARARLSSRRGKYEAIASVILDVQSGLAHLLEMLAPIQTVERFTFALSESTVLLAVEHCDRILTTALAQIAASEEAKANEPAMLQRTLSEALVAADSAGVRPYNQRVRLVQDGTLRGVLAVQKSLSSLCLSSSRGHGGEMGPGFGNDETEVDDDDDDDDSDDDDDEDDNAGYGGFTNRQSRQQGARRRGVGRGKKSRMQQPSKARDPQEMDDPLSRAHIKQASRIIQSQKSSSARHAAQRRSRLANSASSSAAVSGLAAARKCT